MPCSKLRVSWFSAALITCDVIAYHCLSAGSKKMRAMNNIWQHVADALIAGLPSSIRGDQVMAHGLCGLAASADAAQLRQCLQDRQSSAVVASGTSKLHLVKVCSGRTLFQSGNLAAHVSDLLIEVHSSPRLGSGA